MLHVMMIDAVRLHITFELLRQMFAMTLKTRAQTRVEVIYSSLSVGKLFARTLLPGECAVQRHNNTKKANRGETR